MPLPAIFAVQLAWFTLAFAAVARLAVWPWSQRLSPMRSVAVWVGPQMSRVLGWGLLAPNLSPGMPAEFAIPTVIGDSATAVLALLAFVSLMRGARIGYPLAWLTTVVGIADGLHAMTTAAQLGVAEHLAAQWFVPAINMPLMGVCHAAAILALLHARRRERDASAPAATP